MKARGQTPPFRGEDGTVLPGSIAEVTYRRLGGLDQWVMIRGERIANPPLILLHGGPGWSETAFFRHFNAPVEKAFTVVYWDQRGAGKSFDCAIPRSSMTVEQFLGDLDQLVDAVRERLGKERVAIFGHSWGSALGVLYAARFPRKSRHTSAAGRLATGRRPSRALTSSPSQRRNVEASAGLCGSCGRSARRRTRRRPCSRSGPCLLGSRAT